MKKIIISISLCLFVVFASTAQETDPAFTNKQGVYILPEQGDFALGFDALPVLNFFGGNGDFYQNTIYGKYFLSDNSALRVKLTLGITNDSYKNAVQDDQALAANPLNVDARVVDMMTEARNNVSLGIGFEMRRGHGRVQGFYGGELGLGFRSGNNTYNWANPMTALNSAPSSTVANWTGAGTASNRAIETKYGNTYSVGLGAFIGAEYFIAPKLSVGAELSLAFLLSTTGQNETTSESWNAATNSLQKRTVRSYNRNIYAHNIRVSTMPGASVFFMFHF